MSELENKLKYEDLVDMDADTILELDFEEIAERESFKVAPEGVYVGELSARIETSGEYTNIVAELNLENGGGVVEFIQGANMEPKEDLTDEDVPAKIMFRYNTKFKINQFKTDWAGIVRELVGEGNPVPPVREVVDDVMQGVMVRFTHTIYRKKDKDTGEVRKYSNISEVSLEEVSADS